MIYYEHHLGDYAQATAHLTILEDGAYSRLIRRYYTDEAPLPADLKAVQRLAGARTPSEKAAVKSVLEEFFTQEEDGWHSKRCDEEIARYRGKQEKARGSANARWSKKQAQPKSDAEAMRTHQKSDANASPEHSEGNALQSPIPIPHSPLPSVEESAHARAAQRPKTGRSRQVPEGFEVTDAMRAWAAKEFPAVDLAFETQKFRDHEFNSPRGDWVKAWRNWIRTASKDYLRNGSRSATAPPKQNAMSRLLGNLGKPIAPRDAGDDDAIDGNCFPVPA